MLRETSGSAFSDKGWLFGRILVGAFGAFCATWWAITGADAVGWGWRQQALRGLGMALVWLGAVAWSLVSIARANRVQPLGRRRWFVVAWALAAAIMLASIIRVWTFHDLGGTNIGAGLIVTGIPGMILPGFLCLFASESKRLLSKPSRALQVVLLLLALGAAYPSLHWVWESLWTDHLYPEPLEPILHPVLGIPLLGLVVDISALLLPVLGVFYGEGLSDIVLWTFPAISASVLFITGWKVIRSRLRDGYVVTTVSAVTIWLILASRGTGILWLILIGVLLPPTVWLVRKLRSRPDGRQSVRESAELGGDRGGAP